MRDDFSADVKRTIAARAGSRCSNPDCQKHTSGPQVDPAKALNVGVAAHVTAASPGGARHDPALTTKQRASITNAIWLCQNCAKLVDNDPIRFSVDELISWKNTAEATALAKILRPSTDTARSYATSQIWNVPYPPNSFFTGRQQELKQIRDALVASGACALNQPQVISGLGGVGKTQTAVTFAYQWHKEYRAVLWARADTSQSLISAFVSLARLLSLSDAGAEDHMQIVESVLQWLTSNTDWLLILDNADDVNLIQDFIPAKHSGHILLTSRARTFDQIGIVHPIQLEKMLRDEAERLLQKRTGRDDLEVEERHALKQLVRELDYLPLALEQAGAYISRTQCSFASYLGCYSEHGVTFLEKCRPVAGKYSQSVATTWLLNFEQVERASKASADLLRASAFLDPESIPVELLFNGGKELGQSISAKLSETESPALDELLQPACDYSLITRDVAAGTYSIHRLVQGVLRLQLSELDQCVWVERATRAVNEAMPSPDFETWQEFEKFLPHAQSCAKHIETLHLTVQPAQKLLLRIGKYFTQRKRLSEAEQYFLRALRLSEEANNSESDEMLSPSLVNLGTVYIHEGKYREAETVLLRALARLEKDDKTEPVAFSNCLNSLGEMYRAVGRYADAKKYHERALPIFEFMLTLDHPSTTLSAASGLNNLAELYRITRNEKKAERLYEIVLTALERTFAPDHPVHATILNNLGELHRQRASYLKAKLYYERAIEILERLEGPERNYDLATALNNLGLVYYYLGKQDEAEPLLLRAIAIEERALASNHPRLAQGLNNLALIRFTQRRYDEAISLFERALSIWKETLDPNNPELARGLANLGNVYHTVGNYVVAEPLYKQALAIMDKSFGPDDEETVESVSNLWALYYEQKRYGEAEPYFNRVFPGLGGTNKSDLLSISQSILSHAKRYREKNLSFGARKWETFAKELKRRSVSQDENNFALFNTRKKKIGRNDPCTCGSGKKFKKCCALVA